MRGLVGSSTQLEKLGGNFSMHLRLVSKTRNNL